MIEKHFISSIIQFKVENVKIGNYVAKNFIQELSPDVTELNEIIFTASKTIETSCIPMKNKEIKSLIILNWKSKVRRVNEIMRDEITISNELICGNNVKARKGRKMKRKSILSTKETLQQSVQVI